MNRSVPPTPAPAAEELEHLRRELLEHYDRHARDLPWRGEADPYRVWVSEIMLQQTRVDTVLRYYGRWLERFPDVDALAEAERDQVLLTWEGLGYYRRARHLHEAARVVRERHGGQVPSSFRELRALPGLGDYTAGAVASIAFGRRVPAVDGNVRRVVSRLLDVAEPTPAWLRVVAEAIVDPDRPGDWNQALMDLGATVCSPRAPLCEACPWAGRCLARARGTQAERPAPIRRKPPAKATFAVAVVTDRHGRALVVRRPEGGLLEGLWAFPEAPLGPGAVPVEEARAAAAGAGAELRSGGARALGEVRHRFTHLEATYRPVVLAGRGGENAGARWVSLGAPGVALPVAQRKIAEAAAAVRAEGR